MQNVLAIQSCFRIELPVEENHIAKDRLLHLHNKHKLKLKNINTIKLIKVAKPEKTYKMI